MGCPLHESVFSLEISKARHKAPSSRRIYMFMRSALGVVFILSVCCTSAEELLSTKPLDTTCSQNQEMAHVNEVGKTAFFVNAYRVLSEKTADRPLYFDVFGHIFLNSLTNQHMDTLGNKFRSMAQDFGIRTIWFDTKVKQAISSGYRQIVFLGSGLDCRPLRLYDPDVKFFELDQAPVLDYKISKLNSTLGIINYPSKAIRGNYVDWDMKQELLNAGFDAAAPALFVWEGNSMYFTAEMNKQILHMVLTQFPKAQIAFDCFQNEIAGYQPVTEETQWWYEFSNLFTSGAGVVRKWLGPCDLTNYATSVPFQFVERTNAYDVANAFRTPEEIGKLYGSIEQYEKDHRWQKYYCLSLIKAAVQTPNPDANVD